MKNTRRGRVGLAVVVISVMGLSAQGAPSVKLDYAGKDDQVRQDLGDALSIKDAMKAGNTTPTDLVAAAQADYRRLIAVLYGEGFYGPTVSILIDGREAAQISPFEAPSRIDNVRIRVDPGPRFKFGQTSLGPLPRNMPFPPELRPGRSARAARIKDAVQAGVTGWREIGHAKAELASQSITANHTPKTLDVALRLDPGRRLTFGQLRVTGNEDVRTSRIVDIAGLPTGQVFSPDELEKAEKRLRRAGAFRSAALTEAERPGPGDTLDIEANIVEEKPRRFGFGAEIATLDGGTLSAFWLHRNLLGGAERLRVEGRVSGIGISGKGLDYRLGVNFERPATFNSETTLYARATAESLEEPEYTSENIELEFGFTKFVNDDLTVSYGIGARHARTRDIFGTRNFTLLTLPLTAEYDRRDDRLNPKNGYYLQTSIKPFVGVSGTSSGARVTGDARAYRGFGEEDRFVLAGRLQVGSVAGPALDKTPPDYLFYSGGGGTVRGHPYQSLGVDLPAGKTGGQSFAALSAELRAGVTDTISLVGFYDIGFIGDESLGGDGGTHAGAGLGLRYETGIGPIRLDVATPVSGDDAGSGVEFYIGIGQAF